MTYPNKKEKYTVNTLKKSGFYFLDIKCFSGILNPIENFTLEF